ncbi:MAG: MEDS domain-containing protein [Desulfobacterales bacterium]
MNGHPQETAWEQRLWGLRPGAHICFFFESEQEHRALLAPFMRHGIERHEKLIYLTDARRAEQILAYLSADGVPVGPYVQGGQIRIQGADAFCGCEGEDDPEGLISRLTAETGRAEAEGYSGLRVTAEMSRALKGPCGSERLIAAESALNAFFPGSGCLALCQYDRRRFDPQVLQGVLEAHPLAAIGTEIYDNFYHMPPREFAAPDPAAAKLDSWLGHLRERRRSETQIRTLTRKLMQTQEDERCMISRELHDRVGQDLSTIRISLETLFDGHPAAAPGVRSKVTALSGLLDRAIRAIRDLAYDLRPPGLDEMGVVPAMAAVCDEFSEKTGIRVDFRSAGIEKLRLGVDAQINLYRMLQEGLNNIYKHAEATEAVVKLTAAHPSILLRIEDNGRGFEVEKRTREIDSEKRMGLRSLQERTELLGGTMIVASTPGRGTRILIKLPRRG